MSTKQNSKTAQANLFVTRARMATAASSAQSRAFLTRKLAKDARDAAARKLAAKLAEAEAAGKEAGATEHEPAEAKAAAPAAATNASASAVGSNASETR